MIFCPVLEINIFCHLWCKLVYCLIFQPVIGTAVYHRRRNIFMTKKVPDVDDIDTCCQHVHSLAMAESMSMDFSRKIGLVAMNLAHIFINNVVNAITGYLFMCPIDNQRFVCQCGVTLSAYLLGNQNGCFF